MRSSTTLRFAVSALLAAAAPLVAGAAHADPVAPTPAPVVEAPAAAAPTAPTVEAPAPVGRAAQITFDPPPATVVAASPVFQARPAAPAATKSHWYGWQTLAADGAGWTMLIGSVPVGNAPLFFSGVTTLGLGAPIVHAAHGNWGAAAGSAAFRVLGGALAFAVAANATSSQGDFAALAQAANGALATMGVLAVATIVDATALSWERSGPEDELAKRDLARAKARPTFAPQLGMVRGGATVGIGASM